MTRTEAPLCWFVDHEMRSLDANCICVWLAIYGSNTVNAGNIFEGGLYEQLHWLTKGEIDTAIATLVDRQLLVVSPYDDGVTLLEAIEPTMEMETYE